jgi:hypothetical protein
MVSSAIFGFGIFLCSITMTLTMVFYDEFHFSKHWTTKNICGMLGYLTFEIGAVLIMGMIFI